MTIKRPPQPVSTNHPEPNSVNSVTQDLFTNHRLSDLETEIKVLAYWFRSPSLLGHALRTLAHYVPTPCRPEDVGILLLISAAQAQARKEP